MKRTRQIIAFVAFAGAAHAAVLVGLPRGVGGAPGVGGASGGASEAAPVAVFAAAALTETIARWRTAPPAAGTPSTPATPRSPETAPAPDLPDPGPRVAPRRSPTASRAPRPDRAPVLERATGLTPKRRETAKTNNRSQPALKPTENAADERADRAATTASSRRRTDAAGARGAAPGATERAAAQTGAQAGRSIDTTGASDGGDAARFADARAAYGRLLRRTIAAHQRYPRRARLKGWQGVARVRFELDPDGAVRSARIVSSAGRDTLDRAALSLLREEIRRFPAPPPELRGAALRFSVEIAYRLR